MKKIIDNIYKFFTKKRGNFDIRPLKRILILVLGLISFIATIHFYSVYALGVLFFFAGWGIMTLGSEGMEEKLWNLIHKQAELIDTQNNHIENQKDYMDLMSKKIENQSDGGKN